MGRALSNRNVLDAKFRYAEFEGAWLASIGKPELSGSWLIYGDSGSGKTTYVMMLAKYLTNFGKVAYNSLEQGLSMSLQQAWKRVNMAEVGDMVVLLDKEGLPDMIERLKRRNAPDIVIIDSVQYLKARWEDYTKLRDEFTSTLFVFVSQEKNNEPKGALAQDIRYDADVKIRTRGYKAFAMTRFQDADNGFGGQDFIIWEEGANKFWNNH